MEIIFETERLLVRKLRYTDLKLFYELESNINVMQYTFGRVLDYEESKAGLKRLLDLYEKPTNDYWVYAVLLKQDFRFLGTVALIKDKNNDDEIGYKLLEKYWANGYGTEIVKGLISYCKEKGFTKLVANVVNKNKTSAKIIKNAGFHFVEDFVSDDLKLPEQKFELIL